MVCTLPSVRGSYVYLMSNRRNGTLYVGVTADLTRRVWEHRNDVGSVFARRYGLTRLVWFERHETIEVAIRREKALKRWLRAWKVRLIHQSNPEWEDLYPTLL